MHPPSLLPIVLLLMAVHHTIAIPAPMSDKTPWRRDCDPNGCRCTPGTKRGQYCFGCDQVEYIGERVSGDVRSLVFECGQWNGKDVCCNYGPRDSCKNEAKNPCG